MLYNFPMNPSFSSLSAIAALGALAHEHRLAAFRLLVQAGPEGLSAGALSRQLDISPAALSFHLKDLLRAELLLARHEGRQIFYSARFETMNGLIGYLTENCCGGNPCSPVTAVACAVAGDPGAC